LFAILLALSVVEVVHADSFEIDKEAEVDWVKDGDTFNTTAGDMIRLADIDAPEWNQSGGYAAMQYLVHLFRMYGWHVFLDVDDISRNDNYGRLVCVVFVEYNGTHLMNVNEKLVEALHAWIDNYTNNEFDPFTWTLLVRKDAVPEFPSTPALLLVMALTFAFVLFLRRKNWGLRVT
jgi:endonuclease YncB( thermonuclease family)